MFDERDELPRVMREIAETMNAQGTMLTLHPDDGSPSKILYLDPDITLPKESIERLLHEARLWPATDHGDIYQWVFCGEDTCWHALVIPVQRVPGHSRLVISVFFDKLGSEARNVAETVYLERKPFAVGYFRLWQLERTRIRRIEALESALNLVDFGIFMLDRASHLTFVNDAGEAMLKRGDGLRRVRNRLSGISLEDSVKLQVSIEHVIAAGDNKSTQAKTPILGLNRLDGPPLIVSILPPTQKAMEEAEVAAIIYALDPALDIGEILQPICKLYQLTPVETKIVSLLVSGASLSEAATQLRIKEQTARSCLKPIFAKTGTHRQADLVRVMLSSLVRTTRASPLDAF